MKGRFGGWAEGREAWQQLVGVTVLLEKIYSYTIPEFMSPPKSLLVHRDEVELMVWVVAGYFSQHLGAAHSKL